MMSRFTIRPLRSDDFAALMDLETRIFGDMGEAVQCAHHLRVCADLFSDSCFIAFDGAAPVGYLLSFVNRREAACTTLAVLPDYQKGVVTAELIGAFLRAVLDRVDVCWFTVREDNAAVRTVHAALGAVELGRRLDYYGPGDDRIVSRIDRATIERLRPRYECLGFLAPRALAREAA